MKVLHRSPGETQSKEVKTLPSHLGKHSVYTHFPKNPNCDGTVVPKADNFGVLITADHKVLSEESESRHNHRYAVVVQDLATQCIQ